MKSTINTKYMRVLPRDLFNEAKLLKCMGHLCLQILDRTTPCEMSYFEPEKPFEIGLADEGSLVLLNVHIQIKGVSRCVFKTTYNSKANYPLYANRDNCDYLVFDEQGKFTQEFIDFCNTF